MYVSNFRSQYGQETLLAIQELMAIAQFDLEGKIIDANSNFLNLMGYKKMH